MVYATAQVRKRAALGSVLDNALNEGLAANTGITMLAACLKHNISACVCAWPAAVPQYEFNRRFPKDVIMKQPRCTNTFTH